MTGRWGRGSAAACVCVATMAAPDDGARSQDALSITGSVRTSVEIDTNPILRETSPGTSTTALTALGLDVSYETPTSRLAVGVNGSLELERGPDGEETTDFSRPTLSFSYDLEGPDSSLAVDARYRSREVANSYFLDLDGDLVPELIDSSIGDLDIFSFSAAYSFGIEAPFGLDLSYSYREYDYSGTVDPDLVDNRQTTVRATGRFRINEVVALRTFASRSEKEEDFESETVTQTDSYGVGVNYEIGPALRFDGEVGYTTSEETLFGTRIGSADGVSARMSLARDLPDGLVSLSFSRTIGADETRSEFQVNRALETPGAQMNFGLGLTRGDSDDTEVIGSLLYSRELPMGVLSARALRVVQLDADDDEVVQTVIGVDYAQPLTPVTGLTLGIDFGTTEEVGSGGGNVTNAEFAADLNRELTEDWNLTLGYRAKFRDSSESGSARSNTFLASIGRQFSIRP